LSEFEEDEETEDKKELKSISKEKDIKPMIVIVSHGNALQSLRTNFQIVSCYKHKLSTTSTTMQSAHSQALCIA